MKIINIGLILIILGLLFMPVFSPVAEAAKPPIEEYFWQDFSKGKIRFNSGNLDIQANGITLSSIPYVDGVSFETAFNADNNKTIEKTDKKIKYKRSGNGPELNYQLSGNTIKELIVVKKQTALTYLINTSAIITKTANGGLSIKQGGNGITVLPPIAWNKKGEDVDISYSLTGKTLTVNYIETTANHPVYIDPTYVIATTSQPPEASSWEPIMASQPYRHPVTIDNSSIAGALTNFAPIFVATAGVIDFSKVRSDLGNIRFTDGNNNVLNHMVVSSNYAASQATFKFLEATIPASSTTTAYVYYGDMSLTSTASSGLVYSGYTGYFAFDSSDGASITWSSDTLKHVGTLQNNATISYTTSKAGGGSVYFDNTSGSLDDHLTVPATSAFQFITGQDFTLNFFYRPVAYRPAGGIDGLIGSSNNSTNFSGGLAVYLDNSGADLMHRDTNGSGPNLTWGKALNAWYKISLIRNAGVLNTYVDDSQVGSHVFTGDFGTATTALNMGKVVNGYNGYQIRNGYLDEVSFRNTAVTATWLAAETLSINNTYITVGSAQGQVPSQRRQQARTSTSQWWTAYASTSGTISAIYAAYSDDNGQTWTSEAVQTASAGYNPGIAIDSANRIIVVWDGEGAAANPTVRNIRGRVKASPGDAWGAIEDITDSAVSQIMPSITLNAMDVAYIPFSGLGYGANPTKYSLNFVTRTAAGVYSAVQSIRNIAYNQDRGVQLALDSAGTPFAVWEGETATAPYSIWWSPLDGLGNVYEVYASAAHNMKYPDVAIGTDDTKHISWLNVTDNDVLYRQVTASATFSAVERPINGTSAQGKPGISVQWGTNVPVVSVSGLGWGVNAGNYNIIVTRRTGGPWQPSEPVTDTAYDNHDAQLAYARYPVNGTNYTNIPRTGYALTFFSPTGTGEPGFKLHRSSDLAFALPSVTTDTVSNTGFNTSGIPGTRATLNGTLNSMGGGLTNTVFFQWGYSPTLADAQTVSSQSATATGAYTGSITHFAPNVVVYYRFSATNTDGTTNGSITSFTVTDTGGAFTLISLLGPLALLGLAIAFVYNVRKGNLKEAAVTISVLLILMAIVGALHFAGIQTLW